MKARYRGKELASSERANPAKTRAREIHPSSKKRSLRDTSNNHCGSSDKYRPALKFCSSLLRIKQCFVAREMVHGMGDWARVMEQL